MSGFIHHHSVYHQATGLMDAAYNPMNKVHEYSGGNLLLSSCLYVHHIYRGIRGLTVSQEERDKRFDIRRLFEAAASGDATRLEGLHVYLVKSKKKLSDTLCERPRIQLLRPQSAVCLCFTANLKLEAVPDSIISLGTRECRKAEQKWKIHKNNIIQWRYNYPEYQT